MVRLRFSSATSRMVRKGTMKMRMTPRFPNRPRKIMSWKLSRLIISGLLNRMYCIETYSYWLSSERKKKLPMTTKRVNITYAIGVAK